MGNASHYVDATELRHELIQCGGEISERLGHMLTLISQGVASTFRDLKYQADDVVQDSVLNMMFAIKLEKIDLTMPPSCVFNYFTTLAYNSCRQSYRTTINYERTLKRMAMEQYKSLESTEHTWNAAGACPSYTNGRDN